MTELADHVAAARAALARGDDRAALAAALAAWRAAPHARLAEVIARLGQRVAQTVPPLVGTSMKVRKRVWFATLHKRDPSDLDHLLATIEDTYVPAERIQRIDELAALPPDPRIALRFLELIANPRFDDQVSRKHAETVVARLGNPLAVDLPPDPAVDALHADLVDPAAEARDRQQEAALLAAVYAAPADDAPRSIYADWLLARGDPRGEFIALQLSPTVTDETKRRTNELFKTYGDRWLGPIANHLQWPAFERGFLASCHPKLGPDNARPPGDPAWSTVVRCAYHFPPLADARALRETSMLEADELVYFATFSDPPPIEILSLNDRDEDTRRRGIAAIARARLPALRRLQLSRGFTPERETPAAIGWPWRELAVRELSLYGSIATLGAWLAAVRTAPALHRLELSGPSYQENVHLVRDPTSGAFDTLVVEFANLSLYETGRQLPALAAALTALAPTALAHVTIALPPEPRLAAADVAAVHAAVDRQTQLVTRAITHRKTK